MMKRSCTLIFFFWCMYVCSFYLFILLARTELMLFLVLVQTRTSIRPLACENPPLPSRIFRLMLRELTIYLHQWAVNMQHVRCSEGHVGIKLRQHLTTSLPTHHTRLHSVRDAGHCLHLPCFVGLAAQQYFSGSCDTPAFCVWSLKRKQMETKTDNTPKNLFYHSM